MPHGRVGGDPGAGISTPSPGTFSATASTTSSTALGLTKPGFLTELSIRVDGDPMAGTITGGPVKIEAWLARGAFYRQLCSGAIQNEFTVRGSGMLPVSAGDRIVVKWTELSGTAVIVRVDAFVDEETKGENAVGWLDETPKTMYLWQSRNAITQDGAGGGALRLNYAVASNTIARLVSGYATGAATNTTLAVAKRDEDGNISENLASTAAAVSANVSLPSGVGGGGTATNQMGNSHLLLIAPGEFLTFLTGAAAQTESLTVGLTLLLTEPNAPTITTTGSGGTPSAVGASSISAANTWTIVRYPL